MNRTNQIRRNLLWALALGLATAALLPLRGDCGQNECANTTTSLASTINNPVAGDEQFFTLPVGTTNLMILLDTSGSMDQLPQCGDNAFGSGTKCPYPTLSANTGTCNVLSNTNLAWMHDYKPTAEYVDPGRGIDAGNGLVDQPAWGTGCTGNNCLFQPSAVYTYGIWNETNSPTAVCPGEYAYTNYSRDPITGYCTVATPSIYTYNATLASQCRTCTALTGAGFFFYYPTTSVSFTYTSVAQRTGGACLAAASRSVTNYTPARVVFGGGWLNANPPKFMSARKVIKDTVWIDSTKPASNSDSARFGLAFFDSGLANGAKIIVPLGPDKLHSYPADTTVNKAAMAQARQYILDALNHRNWPTGGLPGLVGSSTPMSAGLFRMGQYMSQPGFYSATFGGASYEITASTNNFSQTSKGAMNAPWVDANQCSICWSCQTSAVILVTDGSPNEYPATPNPVPSFFNTYADTPYKANCGPTGANCVSPADSHQSPVSRIAYWLNNTDLRPGLIEPVLKQVVSVSPISINLPNGPAKNILQAVANMGGGTYINADDGKSLADALTKTVETYNNRANSFSAPAASSLSTIHAVSSEAFITRFKPNEVAPFWEGHIYEVNLFDEFLNGCDPTKAPTAQPQVKCGNTTVSANFNQDVDSRGNSICTGVFMVDKDCAEITEYTGDPVPGGLQPGDFIKKGTGNAKANLVWDAGKVLSDSTQVGYRSARESQANSRKILSAVPGASGGFDMVPFDTVAADVARLAPFMSLPSAWCTTLLTSRAKVCGTGESGVPACPTNATDLRNLCARQVIHFVRGWDVTDNNGNGCYGPDRGWTGTTKNPATCASGTMGEERDRANDTRTTPVFWKLGDVFHSSPVIAKPPVLESVCDTGYDNQCVATIHSPAALRTQTAYASYDGCTSGVKVDAYEAYRYQNRDRRRILMVGANDGMLHAFDAGSPIVSATRDRDCNVPFDNGTGEERWAFVPPDMLPRLKDLLDAHQYTVDGNVMARDVWVDANSNRTKEKEEFHTVAIFSERAGGTQFIALDVTDVDAPRMLWTFPPPGSQDAQWMGESWSDFSPRPPPMGPVRLALPGGVKDAAGRNFEERWIAMLNGGYDPTMGAGNAVWMVDVWTGSVVWRFTDDDFKSQNGYGSGTSMLSVPAAVALTDIGDTTQPQFDGDGYFDTATWGDMAGSIFVARFLDPGIVNLTTGRVTNWSAARTFEEQRRADDLQEAAGRSPIFFMTANTFDFQGKALHTYVGSGNRERILQQGEACGPDNLFGCCRGGCSIDSRTTDSYGSCGFSNHFSCASGRMTRDSTSTTPPDPDPLVSTPACSSSGAASCAASPGNKFTSKVTITYTCPSVPARTDTAGVTCDADGLCSTPVTTPATPAFIGSDSVVSSFTGACPKSRFFGVLAYGKYSEKMFNDAPGAVAFEKNRYTDTATPFTKSGLCASTAANCNLVDTTYSTTTVNEPFPRCTVRPDGTRPTKCSATADDPGWFYEYGDTCPVAQCGSLSVCRNEKTGSAAGIVFGCAVWNGFVPVGAQTGSDPCSGKVGTPLVYGYAANYVSGVPSGACGYSTYPDTNLYRAAQRDTLAPPSGGIFRVAVSSKGEVGYSSLQIDPGSSPTSIQPGTRSDIAEPVYWLEVPRQLHDCRHDKDKTGTACE
jgi:type IV pilus assembly protein PilY1